MKRHLPPLNAVKAFDAAARHLSFTKAAAELHVTQGAVSKQIKLLEEYLGKELFIRTHQALLLTNIGAHYQKEVADSLSHLETATHQMTEKHPLSHMLTMNILPSFATYWLIPRISQFKADHPEITISMITGDDMSPDLQALQANIVIRVNDKPFDGYTNVLFMQETMLLVCHPDLLQNSTDIGELATHTLLEHTGRPHVWDTLCKTWQIDKTDMDILRFEHFFMMLEAAKEGLGLALLPDYIVKDDLQKGNLIHPHTITHQSGMSYYLLYEQNREQHPPVQAFKKWLCHMNDLKRKSHV